MRSLRYSRRNDDRSFVGELRYSRTKRSSDDDRSFVGELVNQSIKQSIVGHYSNTEIVRFVNTSFRKNVMEFHMYKQLHSTWIDRDGVLQNHYYYESH